jgi:hypothetical protein
MNNGYLTLLMTLGISSGLGSSTAESNTARLGYIASPTASNGTLQLNSLYEFVLATNQSTTSYELGIVGNGLSIAATDPLSAVTYAASQTYSGGVLVATMDGFNGVDPAGIIAASGEDFNFTLEPGASATFPLSWNFQGFTSAIPTNSYYYEAVVVRVGSAPAQVIASHYLHQAIPVPPAYNLLGTDSYTVTNNSAVPVTYDVTVTVVDEENAQVNDVAPHGQQIALQSIDNQPLGSSTMVNGSAGSGQPVTLTSTTPSICSVSGLTVTSLAIGTCTVAANQPGQFNGPPLTAQSAPYGGTLSGYNPPYFLPAPTVTESFDVVAGSVNSEIPGADAPLPIWALGVLGAGLARIASRRLKKALSNK